MEKKINIDLFWCNLYVQSFRCHYTSIKNFKSLNSISMEEKEDVLSKKNYNSKNLIFNPYVNQKALNRK